MITTMNNDLNVFINLFLLFFFSFNVNKHGVNTMVFSLLNFSLMILVLKCCLKFVFTILN